MRAFLDTCVIYPTVMREVLLGCAQAGLYQPRWSHRVAEEWAHAAARHGPADEARARGEAALMVRDFPNGRVRYPPSLEDRLWLPDPNDRHVLAAAIAGSADVIVTQNARDFPRHILAEEGLARLDADGFVMGFWISHPDAVMAVCQDVLARARALAAPRPASDPHPRWDMRPLLKKARLPRLAKAVSVAL